MKRVFSFILAVATAIAFLSPMQSLAYFVPQSDGEEDGIVDTAISLADNITLYAHIRVTDPAARSIETVAPNGAKEISSLASLCTDDDLYLVSVGIPVKHFASNVTYNVLDADENVLASYSSSAKSYCDVYKEGSEDQLYLPLISALEEYSAVSKRYFANDTSVTDVASADFSSVASAKTYGKLPSGIKHISATLILESKTSIRHYFKIADGYSVSDFIFFMDLDNDNKPAADLMQSCELLTPEQSGDYYYIEISGIAPNQLDTVYKIGVSDGTSNYTCAYGALTYAKNLYTKSSNVNSRNLSAALLAYANAADGFMGSSASLITLPATNYNGNFSVGGADLIQKIRSTPESERILTVRMDFTHIYTDKYIQLAYGGSNYNLIQCTQSSYIMRLHSNIVASASSPKFFKKTNDSDVIAYRLEIVLDYTTGTARFYMNGIKFFDGAPAKAFPEWTSLGNGSNVLIKLNSATLYLKGLELYVGNTGK